MVVAAVFFDLGDVLIRTRERAAMRALAARSPYGEGGVRLKLRELKRSYELGELGSREFFGDAAATLSLPPELSFEDFRAMWNRWLANTRAEDCLFIDDLRRNVAGARAAGMDAVRFRSAGQLSGELRKRGI